MKNLKQTYALTLLLVCLTCAAQAASNDLGLASVRDWLSGIGQVVGPIAFMFSAIKIYRDKREGIEHLSGTIIGAFIFGASASIYALIVSWTR